MQKDKMDGFLRRIRYFWMIVLVVLLFACQDQAGNRGEKLKKNKKITDYVVVTTIGELNMRIEPHRHSTRVAVLPDGAVLDVLGKSEEKVNIGKNSEYWYHLRDDQGISGWVYGAYLILVKKDNKTKAAEIAVQRIRAQKKNVIENLAGFWGQTRSDSTLGPYRLIVYKDGSYLAYSTQGRRLYQGDIEVLLKARTLSFSKSTSFGSRIGYYYNEQKQYGLSYNRYGKHFQMERIEDQKIPTRKKLEEDGYRIIK